MKHPVRFLTPAILLVALFALGACGPSNTVRLLQRPSDALQSIPASTAPSIAVVLLKDVRPNQHIGVKRDNSPFIPGGSPSEWVTRSLADAFVRQGMRATYAKDIEEARASQSQYTLTGELHEVWIAESSKTELSASVKAFISVSGQKGRVLNENLTSSLSKQNLLTGSAAEDLLYNTLQELVQSVANKTQQAIAAQR